MNRNIRSKRNQASDDNSFLQRSLLPLPRSPTPSSELSSHNPPCSCNQLIARYATEFAVNLFVSLVDFMFVFTCYLLDHYLIDFHFSYFIQYLAEETHKYKYFPPLPFSAVQSLPFLSVRSPSYFLPLPLPSRTYRTVSTLLPTPSTSYSSELPASVVSFSSASTGSFSIASITFLLSPNIPNYPPPHAPPP